MQNALLRVQNKTYGICIVTGHLIDKNRLRLVPHATKSVDGKNIANAGHRDASGEGGDAFGSLPEEDHRPPVKPVSEKVRLPNGKRPARAGEEWELDNETIENAGGYSNRKFEDDEE